MSNPERFNTEQENQPFLVETNSCVRILDCGGWTDTWFAKEGLVFNVGIGPGIKIFAKFSKTDGDTDRVIINAANFGRRFEVDFDKPLEQEPRDNQLLVAAVKRVGIPKGKSGEITIYSNIPPGCSVGTSASVVVAMVDMLKTANGLEVSCEEISQTAHSIEYIDSQRQTGIQDQIAAAFGGFNFIEIYFPNFKVTKVEVSKQTMQRLQGLLCTFYLGPHFSSDVHRLVIESLENSETQRRKKLAPLTVCARDARDAIVSGDLYLFGEVLKRNTEAQRNLHPNLISAKAQRIIEIAKMYNSLGWKINGAGGPEGGSITILVSEDEDEKRAMIKNILLDFPPPSVEYLNFLTLDDENVQSTIYRLDNYFSLERRRLLRLN